MASELDPVPWMIDGGAKHSAEIGRMVSDDIAPGANGIREARDFLVTQTATPGSSVAIRAGGYTAQALHATGQAYKGRAGKTSTIGIPATGSTPETDTVRYVIIGIEDPNHGGSAPASVPNGPYNFFYLVDDLAEVTIPHVVLAKITQPPNTGTIFNSMIEDMRELANPRQRTMRISAPHAVGDAGLVLNANGDDGEWFPNTNNGGELPIPYWATRMHIEAAWGGVKYNAGSNPFGQMWVEWGPYVRQSVRQYTTDRYDFDAASGTGNNRDNWWVWDEVYIPASRRGKRELFVQKARYWTTSEGAYLDKHSGIKLEVTFLEVPDPVA